MPISYRDFIDIDKLKNSVETGNFKDILKNSGTNASKYIKGYASGEKDKDTDAYDPHHTSDSKGEEFWINEDGKTKMDGETVQSLMDNDTNLFKRNINVDNTPDDSSWYEDPFIPTFEISIDNDSPLFADNNNYKNSLLYFIKNYALYGSNPIDKSGYENREKMLNEFKNIIFNIFKKKTENTNNKIKSYYITKIENLDLLNKKIINFGEDKIKITLNEDISMRIWYLSELYKNLIYSYKNQRYMFPENLLRFNMDIKINDMRIFQIPENFNENGTNVNNDKLNMNKNLKYKISPKSEIIYTLYDCTFNFFESKNFGNDLTIGGYDSGASKTPETLSFEIYFKSVSRYSNFPLISNNNYIDGWNIDAKNTIIFNKDEINNNIDGTNKSYYDGTNNAKESKIESKSKLKSFMDQTLSKAKQTITNQGLNYLDNLESELRERRGQVVNDVLTQIRRSTINKIDVDNVYTPDFNNRSNIKNAGSELAKSLFSDLENDIRKNLNF